MTRCCPPVGALLSVFFGFAASVIMEALTLSHNYLVHINLLMNDHARRYHCVASLISLVVSVTRVLRLLMKFFYRKLSCCFIGSYPQWTFVDEKHLQQKRRLIFWASLNSHSAISVCSSAKTARR